MPKRFLSKNIFDRHKKDLHQAAKYHWEFKRRNSAYRTWWQKGLRETTKPEGWDERFNPGLSFEELIEFSVTVGMKGFISNIPNQEVKKAVTGHPYMKSALEFKSMEEVLSTGVIANTSLGLLTIQIDFDKIRSVSVLRDYVSFLIDTHYKMFLTPGVLSEDTRTRLGKPKKLNRDFARILEAGDLYEELKRKKSKGIYRQVAEKLYPHSVQVYGHADKGKRRPSKNAVDEAEEIIKEYKRLVDGGYKEILYP